MPAPEQPPPAVPPDPPGQLFDRPTQIGSYKILDELGQGGMGVVYLAEQVRPIHRRVALKILKIGMDTGQIVARFEAERQALAVMDHPNIAKVFDGGATESGRPYFAMELVKGEPITEYADRHRLPLRERVKLMVQVCQAVQHAHQKGVIHRDLKPSNVLVTVDGGRPVPKVIDFGIAKAVTGALTDRTLVTRLEQVVGTPAYMSPEQADGSGLDVDTRTDVFTLGVLLYELLVGALPLDLRDMQAGVVGVAIRERRVEKPSTRFGHLRDSWDAIATCRQTDPVKLKRELKGDLDWIAMKAMAKDRTQRYETANALARDLERYLRHEPVSARAPSLQYRARKFIRRNRAVVALGGVLAILIVAFGVTMAVQAGRIASERDRAEQEAETAEQVVDFLVGLFAVSDPSEARGNTITAREILDRGTERIGRELTDLPVVQSRLLDAMGTVHMGLGLYGEAESLLVQALEARRGALGGDDLVTAESLARLAWLYRSQQRYEEALPLARDAASILERNLGPEDPSHANSLQVLGMIQRDLRDFGAARTSLERSLEIRRQTLDPGHVNIGWSLYHLGWLTYLEGDYLRARAYYEEALPILEAALPPDSPELAWGLSDMAVVLRELGELDEAKGLYDRILSIREKTLGPEHPDVAAALGNQANLLADMGDMAGAIENRERALAIEERAFGPEHTTVAGTLNSLGLALQGAGRYGDARVAYERALGIQESTLGADHIDLASTLTNLGFLLRYVGDYEAAAPVLHRAVTIIERSLGGEHPDLLSPLLNLGFLHRDVGRTDQGVQYMERALAIAENTYGRDHPRIVDIGLYVGSLLNLMGAHGQAEALIERMRAIREADVGASDPSMANVYWELASAHRGQGRLARADSLFQRSIDMTRAHSGEDSPAYAHVQACYWSLVGDQARAMEWFEETVARGFRDPWLLRNPDFDLIRGLPQYEAIAADIRRDVQAAMREGG